jgi:hypothetical protein
VDFQFSALPRYWRETLQNLLSSRTVSRGFGRVSRQSPEFRNALNLAGEIKISPGFRQFRGMAAGCLEKSNHIINRRGFLKSAIERHEPNQHSR